MLGDRDGRFRPFVAGNARDRGLGARFLARLAPDNRVLRMDFPGDLADIVRRLELQDLYTAYADCLDSDAFERCPDFFTEDCRYRITSAENYEAGRPLGLIYATSRNMLHDRISALREANIYEPQRYRHICSGIRIPGVPPANRPTELDPAANF